MQQVLSSIDVLNETIEVTKQNKEALEKMVYDELEVINKQQAQAPDLLKNSSKTEKESQESSQEDKGLFNRVIQFVQRMFRNVLTEVINDYRAKNSVAVHGDTQNNQGKSDIRMVQGGSTIVYNTSFVCINKQELPLEPGQDFHHQSNGVDIRITYNTQKTVPAMNLNINGTECIIQPGQFARYENINHGLKVDVVYSGQNRSIGQSQEVAGKGVANVTEAQISKALGPNNALKGVEVQPAQDGAKLPSDTPKKEEAFCMRL